MANGNGSSNGELKDLQSWPLLVSDVDMHGPLSGAGATGGPLNAVVDRAIREVLGWRPRRNDPKGFRAALRQSFALKEYAGRSEWTWQPHSYLVQTDNGAVTGAQASLFKMAGVAWAQSEPLLDGLTSLCPDECVADVDALRAILRSDWMELVSEIGHAGGPRPQRVDALFTSLLGPDTGVTDPENVQGHLALLRDAMGLERQYVNTIEEEQNLTNYLILVDYTISLRQSWIAMAAYLQREPNGQVFLGTQTTLLNWELAVLGESAQQARYILDSMFIGDAERKTVRLQLDDGPYLTIDEVLQWTEHVALVEGPRLIREGGKAGIAALTPTLDAVSDMLDEVYEISTQPADNPLPAVHSPRAQRTFQELRAHARQALALAEQLGNQSPRYHLSLNVVGEGTASAVETGPYPLGARVHITVEAEDGWDFEMFEPELQQDSAGHFVEIGEDTTVTAYFVEEDYQFALENEGGRIAIQPEKAVYHFGDLVTIHAEPDEGHRFGGWEHMSGLKARLDGKNLKADALPATFTARIVGAPELLAVFEPLTFDLRVKKEPPESPGKVLALGGPFAYGKPVSVEAVETRDWRFVGWSGPVADPDKKRTTITMLDAAEVTAHFEPARKYLDVSLAGDGGGAVRSSSPDPGEQINCSTSGKTLCRVPFAYGAQVTLRAKPDSGSRFEQWVDAESEVTLPGDAYAPDQLTITMDRAHKIQAVFAPATWVLTVNNTSSQSKVTITSAGKQAASGDSFAHNAKVTLEATENKAHEYFDGWWEHGDLLDAAPTIELNMTADRQIEARFAAEDRMLTVVVKGMGAGSRKRPPSGGTVASLGDDGRINTAEGKNSATYADGSTVRLMAAAEPGFDFEKWELSDGTVKTNTQETFTLDQDVTVTASFVPNPHYLPERDAKGGS